MSRELICSVLGVPVESWPPDHYTLIGLTPEQAEPARVESRVQDLSARLRPLQLAHPEEVTDALNRLAQALVCLSDATARAAYDKARLETTASKASFQLVEAHPAPPAFVPAPPRAPSETVADARRSVQRLVYRRLVLLRRWRFAWVEIGRWYGQPERKLADLTEATELIRAAWNLRDLAPLLSATDLNPRPGADVVALAREPHALNSYRRMKASQREKLAADWRAGLVLLDRELRQVRGQVRRRRPVPRSVGRTTRYLVTDGIDITLFVLGLIALGIALARSRN
jgi:hypothetical protein